MVQLLIDFARPQSVIKTCPICLQSFMGRPDKIYCDIRCKKKAEKQRLYKAGLCCDCGKRPNVENRRRCTCCLLIDSIRASFRKRSPLWSMVRRHKYQWLRGQGLSVREARARRG